MMVARACLCPICPICPIERSGLGRAQAACFLAASHVPSNVRVRMCARNEYARARSVFLTPPIYKGRFDRTWDRAL